MSGLNETRFIVQRESCKWKCKLNESVCNSQQKWMLMNVGVNVKNQIIGVLVKNGYMFSPSMCDCECNKAPKIDEHLDTKNNKKRLIGKLVLGCEDKILNTTETSPDDKERNM